MSGKNKMDLLKERLQKAQERKKKEAEEAAAAEAAGDAATPEPEPDPNAPVVPGVGMGRASLIALMKQGSKKSAESSSTASTPTQSDGASGESPVSQVQGKGRSALLSRFQKPREPAVGKDPAEEVKLAGLMIDEPGRQLPPLPTTERQMEQVRAGIMPSEEPESIGSEEPPAPMRDPPVIRMGEAGKKIKITTNYLRLEIEEGKGVFEYEIKFKPQVDSINERHRLLAQQRELIGETRTFDGAKLYLPIELPDHITRVMGKSSSTNEDIEVSIIFKRKKDYSDRECIYLFNVLFRKIMWTLKMCMMNRSFYNPNKAIMVPAHKLEIWPGYVTAVDDYEGGLFVQCDASHRVLRTTTARDVLVDLHKRKVPNLKAEAEKILLGQIVITRYNNKTWKIDDIDMDSTPKSTFMDRDGTEITYMEYYKRQYNLDIKDQEQPLLLNRPKIRSASEAGVHRLICLIPELCFLTGLTDEMRNDFKVMKDVAIHTRITPNQRQLAMKSFVSSILESKEAHSHLLNWGLKMSPDTVKLMGRTLDPETLHFGKNYRERVNQNADWGRTATSKAVLTTVPVDKWMIVYVNKNEAVAKQFVKCFQQQGPRMGIEVANPNPHSLPNDRTESFVKMIRDNVTPQTQLVLTIFPQQRADRYAAVKKLCYVEKPVASQVVCLRTINQEKKLTSVVQKIALQINCKLGGELWASQSPIAGDVMVVGIDAFHDPARKGKSIAGVVASVNSTFSRWYSKCIIQGPNQELADALQVAFTNCLSKYFEIHHKFPSTVIVFRDGLGDSQIRVSAEHEVRQLKSALKTMDGPMPHFGFVVVQKRINTRIFAALEAMGKMDYQNPPPGTVLDHTVCRRDWYDFFLVSQKVGQGTVTPTHYIVVTDGPNMPPDVMQRLSYKLTHMYYNWPGTVRVPAPCQYAHKLAAMVGENLHKEPSAALEDKLFYL